MRTNWDCIVIGGGAAGLSAALVLGRARRSTLLIDAGEPSNRPADGIGGLLGHDGRPPSELYALGRQELSAYDAVKDRAGRVVAAERHEGGFSITDADGKHETASHLILATGTDYELPGALRGAGDFWGHSVFHCPFCHGWEHRDGALGVLGGDPDTDVMRTCLLRAWSDDVTLFTSGAAPLTAEQRAQLDAAGARVDDRPVARLVGAGRVLEAVECTDGTRVACSGLLVPVTLRQRGGLAESLGAEVTPGGPHDGARLAVDAMGQTSVPGLFAVGDTVALGPSVAAAIATGGMAAAGVVHQLMLAGDATAPAR